MPVLVLGGDIYPALGDDLPGNFSLTPMQQLSTNVEGVTIPPSGHWISEEQPSFVIDQLFKFFGNSTAMNDLMCPLYYTRVNLN
jgi:pimeloyl-ACP methyl ester carboxylesterase